MAPFAKTIFDINFPTSVGKEKHHQSANKNQIMNNKLTEMATVRQQFRNILSF